LQATRQLLFLQSAPNIRHAAVTRSSAMSGGICEVRESEIRLSGQHHHMPRANHDYEMTGALVFD